MKVVEVKNITKRFNEVVAVSDASFELDKGHILSLLGPSGCGKTTTLRVIAGFETPDEGRVLIAGKDMRGKRPYERNVGLLFQDYALFPHMTVEQNVAYGLRYRGFGREAIPKRTAEMLSLVKLTGYEKRRPSQLSGGEQQRVALARALATNPEVMLLDEPLSALDAKLRQELRIELKEILLAVGSTTIVVTHDQEEAMSLAEYVIVMDKGRIRQAGSPTEIYARPRNKFVAEFIGRSNWFTGTLGAADGSGVCGFESRDGFTLRVPNPDPRAGGAYEVCVRPERMAVIEGAAEGAAGDRRTNLIPATVMDAAPLGADVHLFVRLASGRRLAVVETNRGQALRNPGQAVTLRFGADDCIVVPAEG
jgi:putative spermidine/putrescine transport system ATP-binding protein/putrescine transport system ATP-binding protein